MRIYFVLLLVQSASLGVVPSTHVVRTNSGDILGSVQEVTMYIAGENNTVTSFVQYLGIPYAEPPVGNLRFKKPEPKPSWNSTHNGTFHRPICYNQGTVWTENIERLEYTASEDCLTLDIYAPIGSTTGGGVYPVMVFIHGAHGGSMGYSGDVLCASGDVIVVVINFRQALFGFFSTGDAVAPGNYGLWDQHIAIKWVSDNINHFNGDPARITVVGHSNGATYAIFQAMYTGNKGLIRRVIAHSASPIPTYKTSLFFYKTSSLFTAYINKIVGALGCKRNTSEEIVSCMRNKPLAEITKGLAKLPLGLGLTPVIDGTFIIADPQYVLLRGDAAFKGARDMFASVDLMTGIVDMEGGKHVAQLWAPYMKQELDIFDVSRWSFENSIVPTVLYLIYGKKMSDTLRQTVIFQYSYLKDPANRSKLRDMVVQLSTDIDSAVPVLKTATIHSIMNQSSTHLYQFSAHLNLSKPSTPSWLRGANHGDDIYFLFGFSQRLLKAWPHLSDFVPTDEERDTARRMMTLWTNFIKTGNPNTPAAMTPEGHWKPFNHVTTPYLDILHNSVSSKEYFREPYMSFWIKIFPGLMTDMCPTNVSKEIPKSKLHLTGWQTFTTNMMLPYTVGVTAINSVGRGHAAEANRTTNEDEEDPTNNITVTTVIAVLGCAVFVAGIVIVAGCVYYRRRLPIIMNHNDPSAGEKPESTEGNNAAITNTVFTNDNGEVNGRCTNPDGTNGSDAHGSTEMVCLKLPTPVKNL